MKTHFRLRLIGVFALALAALAGCGEGDADVCFSQQGIPSYVGRTPSTAASVGGPLGCGAAVSEPPPSDVPGALCDDSCLSIEECGLGDFAACIDACEQAPQCAEAFRCFRDTPCDDQIDECAEELSTCQ